MAATYHHSSSVNCSEQVEAGLRYAVGWTRAYATPAVVLLGFIGNALTVAIFALETRLARWNRFGVWCVALAVSDTSVLILSGFLDDFLGRGLAHIYGEEVVKLDASSRFSCKLLEYLQNSALLASSYLLVLFSADRLITVCQPIRMMTQRYVRHCVAAAVFTAIAGLVLMSPVAAVYDLESTTPEDVMSRTCRVAFVNCSAALNGAVQTRATEYVLFFKTFGIFVGPCLIQAALSLAIVAKLIQVKRLRKELMPSACDRELEMSRYYASLSLSVAFCLLVSPLCVTIVLRTGCGLCSPRSSCRCHALEQAAKLFDSVKDVSYAVNFWVLLVFVRSFRRRVVLALAYGFVKTRLVNACPNSTTSRRAIEMVERLEMKRNPAAFLSQTARV